MYDKTPVYPHQQHLPWAHEPLKYIYVFQRVFTTLLFVPLWAIYYTILPRSFRPRPSWSITQIVVVNFTKRIYKVTEVAGVTWGTRDPTYEPEESSLKETRFAWVPPLSDELRTGIVDDHQVPCQRVGTYIWPKFTSHNLRMRCIFQSGGGIASQSPYHKKDALGDVPTLISQSDEVLDYSTTATSIPASQYRLPKMDVHVTEALHYTGDANCDVDLEADAANPPPRMIGVYLHGGGYCHMSAHENSGTSRIPRHLMKVRSAWRLCAVYAMLILLDKDNLFEEIHGMFLRSHLVHVADSSLSRRI
jgi:hypothetical protein